VNQKTITTLSEPNLERLNAKLNALKTFEIEYFLNPKHSQILQRIHVILTPKISGSLKGHVFAQAKKVTL